MKELFRIFLLLLIFPIVFYSPCTAQEVDKSALVECARLLKASYQEILANPGKYAADCERVIHLLEPEIEDATLAQLYCNYSIPLYYLGEYEKCYEYNIKAIHIFEKLGLNRELGDRYCALGYQIKRRQLDKGFDYMAKGIQILENGNFEKELCSGYDNFGVLHEMKNNLDSALFYYNKSLSLKEKLNDTIGIPYSLNKIGMAYLAQNKSQEAKATLDRSMKLRQLLKDTMGIAENLSFYGEFFQKLEQYETAIDYFNQSLEVAKKLNYIYLVQYNAEQLAKCYEALNQFDKAFSTYKLYTTLKDSISNENTLKTISAMEARFEAEKRERELAEERERVSEANFQLKKQSAWLFAIVTVSVALLLIGFLIYKQQKYRAERLEAENYLKDELHEVTVKSNLQKERLRISRDLHDNIGSQLTFIISSLDNHKFQLKQTNTPTEKIEEITLFARDTISQLRDTIWAMNKSSISHTELGAKISEYIGKAKQAVSQKRISFRSSELSANQLNTLEGINMFRVVQEGIQNAIKHSNANTIAVNMEEKDEALTITIQDNGMGFDINQIKSFGNGLENMANRIRSIDGEFAIDSAPGKGTCIRITLNQNRA